MRGRVRRRWRPDTPATTTRQFVAAMRRPLSVSSLAVSSLAATILAGSSVTARAREVAIPFTDRTLVLPDDAGGVGRLLGSFDLHSAYFGLFLGLVGLFAATGVMLVREQRRSSRRERALRAELASLRGADDLARLLMGSERQLLVSWQGRDGDPRFEGDPSIVGDGSPAQRALAFGAWLVPAHAAAVDAALERLKQRGEAFRLTARTSTDRFIDVEGRTVGGRAILRLRDVTGDRAELLLGRSELATVRGDLGR